MGFVFDGMVLGVGVVLATLPRRGRGTLRGCGAALPCPGGTRGALERRARFWAGFWSVFGGCVVMNRLAGAPRWAARRTPRPFQTGCLAIRRGYGGRCPHPLKGFIP